ncbi:hypothetical protein GRI89_10390 [Altererythrobacter salegens]|uniref:Transposase n=1 Tax=Croceibacterium salegens TaxID=1737568 RepID=A0A6I4SY52_9SPHN|nr:hypothetical protein [Croceibacterium salegens]MXO59947.1 hypothetical protein [Croceibacterium salegens]
MKPDGPFRYFNTSREAITTDGLGSYKVVMSELCCEEKQEVGRSVNNRIENSHR